MATIKIETDQPIASITINFVGGQVDPNVRISEDPTPPPRETAPPSAPRSTGRPLGESTDWHNQVDDEMEAEVSRQMGDTASLEDRTMRMDDVDLDNLIPTTVNPSVSLDIPDVGSRPKLVDSGMSQESL